MIDNEFLIWDSQNPPPLKHYKILWSDFTQEEMTNQVSLPLFVEENADYYKNRYLKWVYDIGQIEINGKSVVEHLEFYDGISYWWLAAIAQKFNTSDKTEINNVIKLFALEDLVYKYSPESIHLNTSNKNLAKTIKKFCERKGIAYFNYNTKGLISINIKDLFSFFELKALWLWLKYFITSIISYKHEKEFRLHSDITFLDSFVHLDKRSFEFGIFHSNYWTELVVELRKQGIKPNWLHNFFPHKSLPKVNSAKKLINKFNKNDKDGGLHFLVEQSFTPFMLLDGLGDYLKNLGSTIKFANLFLKELESLDPSFNFVFLLRNEWLQSMRGSSKLMAHLKIKAYTHILTKLPYQKIGIFIQENQPSELIFIHCWKKARHGQLIGIPHTTVRYWDLRYFYYSKTFLSKTRLNLPRPDKVGVNGIYAFDMYKNWGYPLNELMQLEALRFLHLANYIEGEKTQNSSNILRILICGDFLKSTNEKILFIISQALKNSSDKYNVTFKPHPAFLFNYKVFPKNFVISEGILSELLLNCDLVITSNNTSAAVDSYYIGKPVIQVLDGNFFNISPLRGINGNVFFASSDCQIKKIIDELVDSLNKEEKNYFNLDTNLSLWKKMIVDLV